MMDNLVARLDGSVALSPDVIAECVDDDDALDALVRSLVARATELGLTDPIPRGMRWQATREGWIDPPPDRRLPEAPRRCDRPGIVDRGPTTTRRARGLSAIPDLRPAA
jgi:hypothetical protein